MVKFDISTDPNEMLKALDSKMDALADQIFADSQENIINMGLVDRGTLLNSGEVKREFLSKQVVYNTLYADVIEFGRTPGTAPPQKPIFDWVQRKLGITDEGKAWAITKAIVFDIKNNGTEPRPFLGQAVQKAKNQQKNG